MKKKGLKRNSMWFFWWLRHIISIWVKPRALQADELEKLKLDPEKPVCYIFRTRSISDFLVFYTYCLKHGLPRPSYKPAAIVGTKKASFIYLIKRGLINLKSDKLPPTPLSRVVSLLDASPNEDVQMVPVSIFWGRNPGKEETSAWKLLFFDDEHGGILQRFITTLVHGRNVICSLGSPLSVRSLLDQEKDKRITTKKLRRILKVHFRRQRLLTMGPQIYDRNQVLSSIVRTKSVQRAIEEEAAKKGKSKYTLERRARRYADEIAAKASAPVIRAFDIFLSWVWRKVYSGVRVFNVERLKESAVTKSELVYVASHRSHMDYLLIAHVLYNNGLMSPHTAAGINLNFWPVGIFLRRGGAFFLRRTFRGNRVYSVVFNEYLRYLLAKGFPVLFFPEGGRSRTGRLLKPKLGMLKMIVQGYAANPARPILFVPTYVGYDKIIEGASYHKELSGAKKKSESVSQLFAARKILRSNFGGVYVNYAEPIDLRDYLDGEIQDGELARENLQTTLDKMSHEIMVRMNQSAVVSQLGLFATILLSSPRSALSQGDLLGCADAYLKLMEKIPYSDNVVLVKEKSLIEALEQCEKVMGLKRFKHIDGDVIFADEWLQIQLTYYKNNILHLFVAPSLVAACFQHNDHLAKKDVIEVLTQLYPFFQEELFLTEPDVGLSSYFDQTIEALVAQGLLLRGEDPDIIERPDVVREEASYLNILGRMLTGTIERYSISASLLSRFIDRPVEQKEFEKQCQALSKRLSLLSGGSAPEFFDKSLFSVYFEVLKREGYADQIEGELTIMPSIQGLIDTSAKLISLDVRHSIARETSVRKDEA